LLKLWPSDDRKGASSELKTKFNNELSNERQINYCGERLE